MAIERKDNWTEDEDTLLANIVLDFIGNGKTQLQAFQSVGTQLGRTPSACGFRWNSFVRKKYKEEINLARQQRNNNKEEINDHVKEPTYDKSPQIQLGDIITFLEDLNQQFNKLISDSESINQEYEQLKKEHYELLMVIDKASRLVK